MLVNIDNMSLVQKKELQKYGVSLENIPESLLEEFVSFGLTGIEQDYLRNIGSSYNDAGVMEYDDVCIKNIEGTIHPSYNNKTIIEAYSSLKRGNDAINKYHENPDYYQIILKDKDRVLDDEITLVKKNNKYYITQGNNRLITQLVNYLAEKENVSGLEELEQLDKKYTFSLKCATIPENEAEMVLINFIKKVNPNIKISKSNVSDELYNVIINNETIKINSLEDIKKIIVEISDFKNLNTGKEKDDVYNIFMTEYFQNSIFKGSVVDLDITEKFLKIYELRQTKFKYYKELISRENQCLTFDTFIEELENKRTDMYVYLSLLIKNIGMDNFKDAMKKVEDLIPSLPKEEREEIEKKLEELPQMRKMSSVNDNSNSLLDIDLNSETINKKDSNNFYDDWKNRRLINDKQELLKLLKISINYQYLADSKLLEDSDVLDVLWKNINENRKNRNNMEEITDREQFFNLVQNDILYFAMGTEELRNDDEIIQFVLSVDKNLISFVGMEKQDKYYEILYPTTELDIKKI